MIKTYLDDRLLPLACWFFSKFKQKKAVTGQKFGKILFICLSGAGDAVLSLPTIKRLKEEFPDSELTVYCIQRNHDVFLGQPFIDRTLLVTQGNFLAVALKHFREYGLCVDTGAGSSFSALLSFFMAKRSVGYSEYRYAGGLQGKFSPRLYDATVRHNDDQHAVSIVGDILKPLGVSFKPKALVPLYCDPKSKEKVDGLLARNGINPAKDVIVGIHPFAAANVAWRAWPRERFVELIERIKKENDCRVILTGQPTGGIDRPAEILAGLSDRTGVYYFNGLGTADLFCLIKNYDLMVSIDTGPMHIAAAQGVKTIGLFGPKPPERSGPFPLEEHVCFHHKYDKCEHPTVYEATACMKCRSEYIKLITVDEVFAAVKKSLKKKR